MHRKWYVLYVYKDDKDDLAEHSHVQLSAIASLHDRHYIHRDVKPSNFTVRVDDVGPSIFLIDFGLARQFRNPATYLHIQYTENPSVVGTLPFTSVNGQRGDAQSRRDDLESLAYTIIFLARGDLPWIIDSICGDRDAVLQKKMLITAEELCEGLPPPLSEFVTYVRSLSFDKKPDYNHLHNILSQCSQTDQPSEALIAPCEPPPPPLRANRMPSPSNRV